jgi:hypothetical protein
MQAQIFVVQVLISIAEKHARMLLILHERIDTLRARYVEQQQTLIAYPDTST